MTQTIETNILELAATAFDAGAVSMKNAIMDRLIASGFPAYARLIADTPIPKSTTIERNRKVIEGAK